jgi:hypothetical protein
VELRSLFSGDAQAAVARHAEAEDPTACAIMNVAYMRGSQPERHGTRQCI